MGETQDVWFSLPELTQMLVRQFGASAKVERTLKLLKRARRIARYDRERMGLPPVACEPLEQSLRFWLCAGKLSKKRVSVTRHGPF